MSACLLSPIGEYLKGKSENKQGKNVALLRICTLAVSVLFCFSGRNSWQLKSVLSTQSENVIQMLQGFVTASLALGAGFIFLWMEGQRTLKKQKGDLAEMQDQLSRTKITLKCEVIRAMLCLSL